MRHILTYLLLAVVAVLMVQCKSEQSDKFDLDSATNLPELFAENIISTGLYERDLAISPDGKELIYTIGNYKQSLRSLVIIENNGSGWGEKSILSFSGRYNDIEPFFSPDGAQLFFASDRPPIQGSDRSDYNIWVCQKMDGTWQNPKLLDTIINTTGQEYYPSVAENGNLYFTATRSDGIGREDVYVSTFENGAYQQPMVLDTNINSTSFEFNAYIHPNEDYLIFSSFGRPDGLGGGDLYISRKDANGNWTPAQNLKEPINTSSLDYCPFIDLSNNIFYFTSERSAPVTDRLTDIEAFTAFSNQVLNGLGNIYRVNLDELAQ